MLRGHNRGADIVLQEVLLSRWESRILDLDIVFSQSLLVPLQPYQGEVRVWRI